MARLPTALDLGSAAASPSRPVGTYDVSGFARGAQALAGGAEALGKGVSNVGGDIAEVNKEWNESKYLDASAGLRTDLSTLHNSLQNSKDYANLDSQWARGSQQAVDRWAKTVSDGRLRQHFLATSGELVSHGAGVVKNLAFNGLAQSDADSRKATLFDIQKRTAENPDDPMLASDMQGYDLRIESAVRKGFITPEHAELEKRQAGVTLQTADAQANATRTPLKFLRETGGLPRGAESLPSYWNKEAARRASGVNEDLMAVVKRASEISGVQFVIGDKGGTRDQVTQDQLVAAGRSQTRDSNHLTGNAIDLIPIVNGKPSPDAAPEQYAEISRAMKQASAEHGLNVRWGGDFKSFKDDAHFELPGAAKGGSPKYGLLDPNTMLRMQTHAQTILRQQATDEARIAGQNQLAAAQGYERLLQDASDGRGALPPRKLIEDDPALDEGHRNQLLRQRATLEKQTGAELADATMQGYVRGIVEARSGRGDMPSREAIEKDPALSDAHRNRLLEMYDAEERRQQSEKQTAATDHMNGIVQRYARSIIDARAGRGDMPTRESIQQDWELDEAHRNQLLEMHDAEQRRLGGEVEGAEADKLERNLIDAAAGRGVGVKREDIEQNPVLGDSHRNRLLRQWDAANKQDEAFQSAWARFKDSGAGPFNQVNDDDKKQVDKIYQVLASGNPGNEVPALQMVVDRTGIIPASAASAMRGALVSNSAQNVLGAAQMARNLLARNPQIFTGVSGGKDIEDAAISYGQYTEHFGMTPEQAARKIIEDNSPEYKAQVAARIKNEDVPTVIKNNLAVADLQSEFNEGWTRLGRPAVDFTEGGKQAAFNDYAELFKERYLQTGNVATAKAQAIEQMKKVWGVSFLNGTGSGTLMRYPPERAPAYAGIPDPANRIADAAIAAIKSEIAPAGPQLEAGAPGAETIARDKIILTPTPGGETAQAYMAGKIVPYALSWFDKDGRLQMLNPGKAFVFDGDAEREKISEERRTGLEKGAARLDADERALGGVGTRSPAERLQAGPERRSDIMSDENPDAIIPGAQYAANLTPLKGSTESVRPGRVSGEGGGGGARIDFKSSGAQRGEPTGAGATKSLSDLTAEEVAARDANSSAYQARLKERLEAIAKTKEGREAISGHAKKIEDSDRIDFRSAGARKK